MNKTFNIVFTGVVRVSGIYQTCAVMFDTGWSPRLVYKSTLDDKYRQMYELLGLFPNGFIIVPVVWGPKKFISFEEFSSFISNTSELSKISGPRKIEELDELSMSHGELISADIYNELMTKMVSDVVDNMEEDGTVVAAISIPHWFKQVYEIRREMKEPLTVSNEPSYRR